MFLILANNHDSGFLVVLAFAAVFVSVVGLLLFFAVRSSSKRIEELREFAKTNGGQFFDESAKTKFAQQVRSLDFPLFRSRYWGLFSDEESVSVTNIVQIDLDQGRLFIFDYRYSLTRRGGADIWVFPLVLCNKGTRVTKPVVVSNCLTEMLIRRFWRKDHLAIRSKVRSMLTGRRTCRVEITNCGILYLDQSTEYDEKMQFVLGVFDAIEKLA